jgi:hypothetical protein
MSRGLITPCGCVPVSVRVCVRAILWESWDDRVNAVVVWLAALCDWLR